MSEPIITFPKDFLWGASTAAYQIEGGNRRSALWDWEKRKGWERSAEAANSWELFDQDVECLKSLHLNAYRFSVEWSRVQPEPDRFDEAALSRYAAWAARLKKEGIRPFVCFHHFSEPAWLLREHPRGWADENVAARFLRFVEKAAAALMGSVTDWVTFNEPVVFLVGGYGFANFPPGRWMLTNPRKVFLPVIVKNMCDAHKETYRLLHRLQREANVGIAHNICAVEPAGPKDAPAVETWDWFMHRNFLDQTRPFHDYLGINYYTRIYVKKSSLPFTPLGIIPGYAELEKGVTPLVFRLAGGRRGDRPRTGMDWEVVPEGFGKVVYDYWKDYRKPVLILENGMAEAPGVERDDFLRRHLASLHEAMSRGAQVRGYFHWSLVDNYEWGSYKPRFGLFTRDRKPAAGAALYAETAKTGRLQLSEEAARPRQQHQARSGTLRG